jgi:hypothetical protein
MQSTPDKTLEVSRQRESQAYWNTTMKKGCQPPPDVVFGVPDYIEGDH